MENKKLWFKAKRYGWGWYPVSWEGWVVLAVYTTLIIIPAVQINNNAQSGSDALIGFAPYFIIFTGLLLVICYRTGEYPRWRWGQKK